MDALVERLRDADNQHKDGVVLKWHRAMHEAAAEIERLRAALEPFAEAVSFFSQRYLDTDAVFEFERRGETARINVGDLRRARAALSSE
jgi:hypothetical protein